MPQKEPSKACLPIPLDASNELFPLFKVISLSVVIAIFCAIAVVLFKMNFIDSHGSTRACLMIMLFASDALYSIVYFVARTTILAMIHMGLSSLGLAYWIVLDVNEYKTKNTWPSIDLLLDTGVWFFMVTLSLIEYIAKVLFRDKPYCWVYYWYSIAVALVSMIVNYWTRIRETSAVRLKSQFIKNAEKAFDDFIRSCMKESQIDNTTTMFDQTLTDFTMMLSILVAQQQETVQLAEEQEQQSGAQGAQTSRYQEVPTSGNQ